MKLRFVIILLLISSCLGISTSINSFNSGELSPLLDARNDIAKYYSGCRILENMLVYSYGGATRRPGTKFIVAAKNGADTCRLISFEYALTQAYVIEAGDEYMRFFRNRGQILSGGSAFEISTPYDINDVFQLQMVQSADTMYIVHPDYAQRKLTRSGHTAWTLTEIDFERGPFLDENETTTTITPSATTGTVTLTASSAIWDANHVGAKWQVTHVIEANSVEGSFTAADVCSTEIDVQLNRTFDFSTHGTWTGTILLQRSFDASVTWEDVRVVHYEGDGNITYSDEEIVDDAIYRVRMDSYTSGTARYSLIARSHKLNGVVDITAFASSTSVTATVENTLGGTDATAFWSEGAWSVEEGYPSAVAFYEERLVFAATTEHSQDADAETTEAVVACAKWLHPLVQRAQFRQ